MFTTLRYAGKRSATVARSFRPSRAYSSESAALNLPKLQFPGISGIQATGAGAIIVGCGVLVCAEQSYFLTDAGVTYVHQNTLTGNIDVYGEPGIHRRMPFFSTVSEYKQVITESFGPDEKDKRMSTIVRFADTYTGAIPSAFRFKLPQDPDKVIKIHKEFRNQANLEEALLDKNAQNVTIITATQYTGEEFFQGGLNVFKSQLADQLANGVYETVRKQVEVEQMDLAPVGVEGNESGKVEMRTQLVWKTVPVYDEKTGLLRRAENPLAQYGIEVTQVTIGDPKPEQQLETLLMEKKRLVAERIKAVQEQETAKAQAKTEQLKKEILRTKEVQDAQREKELAVIGQVKEVEVAKQIAARQIIEERKHQEIAQIERETQLEIARANLEINQANALAAKAEAEAIMAKGTAEAAVLDKKYSALQKNKEIYLAEMQRDVAQSLYANLKEFKVNMPQNYIQGDGSGRMSSNLDVITGLAALGTMKEASSSVQSGQARGWLGGDKASS